MPSSSRQSNQNTRTVAHRTAGVVLRRRFVDAMGYWLIWALAGALVLIVLSRLIGLELGLQWWGWLILAAVMALVPSLVVAGRHRMTLAQGGGVLDDRLGLNSQIRSAIELESDQASKAQSPGFVALAQQHAESAAADVEIGQAFDPIDTKHWWRAGLVLVLAIVAGVWMPMRVSGEPKIQTVIPEQAIAKIDDVEDSIRDLVDDARPESPAVQEAIADLESLKEELAQGVDDPEQANARTAAKLEELADALDDQAEQEQAQANELSDRIAEAQNQSEEQDGWDEQLDDFAEAIKVQDYEDAQQELDELREQVEQMSDAQREALADQLEDFADAVEPDSLEDEPAAESMSEPSQELADSIREEEEEIREPTEPEPEAEQEPSQDETEEQAEDDTDGGETGQEQDSESEESEQEQANEGESQEPSEQEGEESAQREPEQSETGEEGESRSEESDETGKESESQEQQGEETQEQSQEGDESGQEPEQGDQQEGKEQGRQQGEGDESEQPESQSSEGEQQGQDEPESGGEQGEAEQVQREGRRSLDETLEEMEKRKERSQRSQEQADDVREQARKLIDPNESQEPPEGESQGVKSNENQQDQRGSAGDEDRTEEEGSVQPDPGAVRDFVPVDASDPSASDNAQPVGKWYAPDGEAIEPSSTKQAAQRFREASEKAQRAIEDQQVPRKYRRVVREAFKRVNDRASELESGGKVAPQGKDATPKSSSKDTGGDK